MTRKTLLILMSFSVSSSWATGKMPTDPQTKYSNHSDTTKINEVNVIEQETIVVSDSVSKIPAPLQSEAMQIRDWSGSASIGTDELWQNQRATNIKDVLNYIPGIFVQQRNGAESARISIRGSGLGRPFQGGGLLLLQDGVPLNTADGSFDFQAVDPWLIDYVTVYRGANGMALGGSSLGGVINLGTTLPDIEDNNQFRLTAGSFSTGHVMSTLTTRVSSSEDALRLRVSHFNQQGFRVQNQQNSNRIDLQYLFNTESDLQHRWGIYHLNTHAELPSSLSRALIMQNPRQSRGFNTIGNFNRDLSLSRLSYQISNPESSQQSWSATFYMANKTLNNPVFTYINRDSDDAGLNLNWQQGNNRIVMTSQWGQQDELRRENQMGFAGDIRLFRQQTAQTTSFSYQHKRHLLKQSNHQQLTLSLSLQAIYARRDIDETFPVSITSHRNYSQINPRLALLFQNQDSIQWYTSLARSFEAPTFAELNNGNQAGINQPIKAQSADSFEFGSRGFTERISWDISAYYSQLDNEFIRFRFPDGSSKTTNARHSTHWGLETGLTLTIKDSLITTNDQLKLLSNYLYNQFQLDKDPVYGNNYIPGIPEHYLQSSLHYEHPSGWSVGTNIEWVPTAYYIDLANSYRTENYLLTGLSISYSSPKGFELFVDVKNLNDQTYISTTLPIPDAGGNDGNYFYSGEGRAIYTGVKWQF